MSPSSLPQGPVVVAILTYKRPLTLEPAVQAVAEQAAELDVPIDILIVDNDPERSAEDAVAAMVTPVPVHYLSEPTPGIAAARNAALKAAADYRLLVFFDDDQSPEPNWLRYLLEHWERVQCAAVAGPVLSVLPDKIPDPFVVASGIFETARFPTGTKKSGAGAGSLLLDMNFLRDHKLQFDPRLGLRGGEDTLLTHEIVAAGGIIEWCDEAVATEPVAPERMTHSWMRRRAFRSGASWARSVIATTPGRRGRFVARVAIAARSVLRILMSVALIAYGLIRRDNRKVARQTKDIYSLAGALSALVGAQEVEDYSRG